VDAVDLVQSIFRTFFRRVRRGCYDVPDGEELWKLCDGSSEPPPIWTGGSSGTSSADPYSDPYAPV
jgi:hypothetical protein